jgi:peptidoglycan/xylan/chitin deacetylase (PgdA/CDA1 family)
LTSSKVFLKITATNLLAAAFGWIGSSPYGLRVLTFHNIDESSDGDYSLSRCRFLDCLKLLKNEGYRTIRARDIADTWPSVLQHDRIVALTFDDGYKSHRDVVAEVLADLGMTATFFVLSSQLGGSSSHPALDEREPVFLSAGDIREMDAAGFEIGSHSHTHPLLGTVPPERAREEISVSKQILEQELGHSITSFAFPFGRQGAYTKQTRAILEESSYACAFTQEGRRVRPGSHLLELPRTSIDRFDTWRTFQRKLHGHYELIPEIMHHAKRA